MIQLTSEFLERHKLDEPEIRREIALLLFTRDVPAPACAAFAGMSRFEFQQFHGSRGIPIQFGVDDLDQDLDTLRDLGEL